ncbi:LacI family DNA-binding transcriptional regulator [Trinickia sp. NRRL B-1857]|uniref:LacI family DNA-binding transcriptional regulator n=1 Tax=Trinickia sp. NRRL B-1857 TaxID=3162879 RepID=UPI003D2C11F5
MNEKEKDKSWATAEDVARLAGVSRSAVSRAFTPGASVSTKTRERIMRAAQELGYQVDYNARNMIQGRSSFVGVVTSGLDNPFRVKLLAPIAHYLGEHGFLPILMNADDSDQIAHSLQILLSYRIAGVIMTSGAPPLALAREYLNRRVPVAMVNRAAELDGADVVNSDNEAGGRLAAQRLIEAGAKRFAFVGPHLSNFSGKSRCDAFVAALKGLHGKRGEAEILNTPNDSYESGQQAANQLLNRARGVPDGVFCATDMIALGFMDAARHRFGRRVPEDLRIVGFDDIPHASLDSYRLTTVAQNVQELARQTVQVLVERMADFHMPARMRSVPVALIERESAGVLSG